MASSCTILNFSTIYFYLTVDYVNLILLDLFLHIFRFLFLDAQMSQISGFFCFIFGILLFLQHITVLIQFFVDY